jgi:ATP-dependent helicase HrpB
LPLALLDEAWLSGKKIIMLEPRRLAARGVANRMAELLGENIADTVGFRIRFENRIGKNTRLEVVTEGILTRMLQNDNALENVGLIIFDEFHERSLNADLALALCREAQQVLRPDLRLLIMSATLNMPALKDLLNCPVLESEGKLFPVDIIYNGDADEQLLPELAARAVVQATQKHEGDCLVFLPGEGDIRKCEELLKQNLSEFLICPLYGQLPQQEQLRAIFPDKNGKRKVVLATSIAETSLTIEGVKIVIDSGFGKVQRFDPASGLSKLETVRISKDSADQRAGRAGRLSPGVCYRLWTAATNSRLAEHRTAEILEADLCSLVLDLCQWGVQDVNDLIWLTPPPTAAVAQAKDILEQIGATEKGKITAHGKQIQQLACHPRLAHMLLMAKEQNELSLATDLAAVLEERDPLGREAGADLSLRIEALRRSRANGSAGRKFSRIEKVAETYRRMLNCEISNAAFDSFELGLLLAYAYPERIASARPGNNAQFQLANGKIAAIGHKDDLAHQPWLAVAQMDLRSGLGKIFLAAPLNPKDLLPMVKTTEQVVWDTRKGGIVASRDLRIGNIVLQSKPITKVPAELIATAISNAIINEGEKLLTFDEKMEQLRARILSLKLWNPYQNWPAADTDTLLQTNGTWLMPYLSGISKADDLKKIDLADAFFHSLTIEQQALLNRLTPEKIDVPSGSKIRIQYFTNGASPVLSVRLQEVFGVADTPIVNEGKTKLVMHLLSPGYKPVQVTSDLRSFWNNLYFEVKKELQRRYPKHSWPDDPWTADAVAKGRPQR